MKRALAVAGLAVLLVGCMARPDPRSRVSTLAPSYGTTLPWIARNATWPPTPSPKKGVVVFGNREAVDLLGASWYVDPLAQDTDGRAVPVLTHATPILRAINQVQPPLAETVMVWNEPDLIGVTVSDAVGLFVMLERRWPGRTWVVPNVGRHVDYVAGFVEEYEAQTGRPLPAETRLSVHCYERAEACVERIEAVIAIAEAQGLAGVWVTEFGRPLWTDRTMQEVQADNDMLVGWMEAEPMVERYAYWSTTVPVEVYRDWGTLDPTTGWIPLVYDTGDDAPRLTWMGRWYANDVP